MDTKKHFKLYKSGKLWVSAAIVSLSVMAGVVLNNEQAKAADNAPVAAATTQSQINAESTENISRQVNYKNADGTGDYASQTQTATVKTTTDANQNKTYNVDGSQWSGANLTVPEGMNATINGKTVSSLPTNVTLVNGQPDTTPLNVIFVKNAINPNQNPSDDDLKNQDMYKKVTRTINYVTPGAADKTTVKQEVVFGRTKTQQANGQYVYGDWKALGDGKSTWTKYDIPAVKGYVSKITVDGKDHFITSVDAQDVTVDTKDATVNVSYVPASSTEEPTDKNKDDQNFWRKVTRTINYKLTVGTKEPTVQTVWFKRSKITTVDATGKATTKYTDWAADGNPTWDQFTIPQLSYYHTEIDGQRGVQFNAKTVSADTPSETHTVTYVSDGTDPYNQQVVPGLKGNWASIDNIYMTDTGIHVTGWNANSDSYNRNYHFLIILDYGPNPVNGQYVEVGRKLITGGVNRPDVFKVHPVWNAATSGFDDTVVLNTNQIKTGDKLRILSRWTNDINGNNDAADLVSSYYTMDYNTNVGSWDSANIVNDGTQLEVSGWHATNASVGRSNHFVILYDATTNSEVNRQLVKDGINRQDVSNAYQNLLNASKSGFKVQFNLSNVDLSHNLQIISRYSDAANGEGSHVDYWFPARRLFTGDANNYGHLDGVSVDTQNGKLNLTGWNATNLSQVENNRFLILYDTTANRQVDSIKLDDKTGIAQRDDVRKAYPGVQNALNSGFNYGFDLSKLAFGHTYAVVSRYSSQATGNGNDGAHVDYWFNNAFTFNQQGYSIDSLNFVTKSVAKNDDQKTKDQNDADKATTETVVDPNQLHVSGWMASDAAAEYRYTYVIVLTADNKELGRSRVELAKRDDVQKVFPTILNAGQSGFDTVVKLDDAAAKLAQTTPIKFVLRYTNDKAGNGNPTVDQYTNNFKYDQAANKFVQA
ncbi:MAG TPA: KxYKxGKxW signal peptide domain-containing protein [Candidatus Limosilactobacillus excrementigallinarum]|nr:KxYKxGKxW signal peptide domain-containing protein [Candidatus Limosilactobacillus excrementigallinarum]